MASHTSQSPPREVAVAVDALRRLVQSLRAAGVAAEHRTGVSGAQLFVLQQLAAAPAPSLNDLATRTLTHQSSVSVVVSRLVKRGLVSRAPDARDGRRRIIQLTPAGRALLRRAPETFQARLVATLRELPAAQRRLVARGLHLIVRRLRLSAGPVPMFLEDKGPRHG